MYVVAMILFIGGMFLMSRAFFVEGFEGFVFFAGILCIAAAMALPMIRAPREPHGG